MSGDDGRVFCRPGTNVLRKLETQVCQVEVGVLIRQVVVFGREPH